jgi:hypothetical protein
VASAGGRTNVPVDGAWLYRVGAPNRTEIRKTIQKLFVLRFVYNFVELLYSKAF